MSESQALTPREQWTYRWLAVFIAVVWLGILGVRPLFNPDEGRYAEIPREMSSGGDWVIPHLNGLAYIEKPPLQFWATAVSYRILGATPFAARLYTALTALATLLTVGGAARRLWGAQAAWRAMAVLTGMLMFVILGQLLTLDMSLTFYMTAALAAFLVAQSATRPPRWMLLAWAAAAGGVLTKGLIAAAIPAAVLILYSLYTRDFAPWRRLNLRWGLPLFLALSVPWHGLAALRLRDFLEFFFVHEHLARYLTPIADRQEPWWYFGGVFLVGSMPWTLPSLRVLGSAWRRRGPPAGGEFQPAVFLWIWVVFIGVFFSLSDSKLMPYILPVMPALALLIAAQRQRPLERDFRVTAWLTVAAGVSLGLASLNWPRVIASSDRALYFLPLQRPLGQIALLLIVSGAFVLAQRRRTATGAAVFLGAGWCLAWLLVARAAALVAPVYSGVDLAAALESADPAAPVYSVGTYDQSLTFYLRRTVTLVAYRGELDYGLGKAPAAEIGDVAEFLRRWAAPTQAFAVMEKGMFNDLRHRGVPMRKLAQTVNRVLVARQ